MKRSFLITILLFLAIAAIAQQPEDLLAGWHSKAPIEKVYLQTDRDSYLAGDTIWFKAYLASDYLPDTASSVLMVSLNDASGKSLFKVRLPIVLGISNGQLPIPSSLATDKYSINAFTATLLNNGPDYVFKKKVSIYGKMKPDGADRTTWAPDPKLFIDFFPEGGNFITGVSNTIAFKATNEFGWPGIVHGSVFSSKRGKILDLNVVHDGMGFFELEPSAGETFYLMADTDPEHKKQLDPTEKPVQQKYNLPVPSDKGTAVSIIPHPEGSYFEVHTAGDDVNLKPAYMLGQMQHRVVFRQDFAQTKTEWQGVLNTRKLHSGIMQITIFNANGLPLAERLVFVQNKEYIQSAALLTDTVAFSRMARNRFRFAIDDTVQGNVSIAITDADYEQLPNRQESIFSSLLLTSDLKGSVNDPGWYFRNEGDSVTTAADLLMMTNGWRRFKWTELAQKVSSPLPYSDPAYITLSGRAFLRGTKKPLVSRPLILLLTSGGHLMNTQTVFSDEKGYFKSDSLIFYGAARAFIIEPKNRKSNYIEVEIDSSMKVSYVLPVTSNLSSSSASPLTPYMRKQLDMDYNAILKAEGLMLEGVTVQSVTKSPTQIVEEHYTAGAFETDAFVEKKIDLINTSDLLLQDNIFEYLKSRVPGLVVADPDYSKTPNIDPQYDETKYRLYYRQMPSVSGRGNPPMAIYLNEVETDPEVVGAIPVSEIAFIKIFSAFTMATGGGQGGAIAIYTKKDLDMPNTSKGNIFSTTGFSVIKEFYAPEYKEIPNPLFSKPDNRITLDWRPNIFFNAIGPRIPFSFYNNDRTKKFRVVIEGMTTTGKLIMIDKIVE